MTPTHTITGPGPFTGLRCWVHANGGDFASVRYSEPGWPFPKYAVVRAERLQPIVPSVETHGAAQF
jgi:hypothetical protein